MIPSPLAGADWTLAVLRDSSSCPRCGSLEPAVLGREADGVYRCSDCPENQPTGGAIHIAIPATPEPTTTKENLR